MSEQKAEETLLKFETKEIKPKRRINRKMWSFSVFLSICASILSILSCFLFSFFFQKALSGFSKQVNAFVQIGSFASYTIQTIVSTITILFIVYLLFVFLSSAKILPKLSCFGNSFFLFTSSLVSQSFLVLWTLLLCFVSSITLVYSIFIGSIFSFCGLLDQQCFDFKVLIPAIVSKISNKKIDMVMCEEKKELLCSQSNNQFWSFVVSFILCILCFAGLLLLQNCVVFGLGQKSVKKTTKEENYEMERR